MQQQQRQQQVLLLLKHTSKDNHAVCSQLQQQW
jgi:hypothetical protein